MDKIREIKSEIDTLQKKLYIELSNSIDDEVLDNLQSDIAGRIASIRKQNKLTQQELADILDMSRSNLANIEVGNHKPNIEFLYKICCVFDINSTKVLGF